jgi:tRNA G18 (ribose-2'-O)-methylase SpoU
VPKDVLAQADEVVAIPQSSRVESLNAGIAASILLYETARQRKITSIDHGDHGTHGG